MRELILNGIDADGTHLLLTDDAGQQYRLAVDEALYSAVRRDRVVVKKADGPVRPREIQAMIRGGMTAEEVVAATGADLEHVRTYERPAMAERAHMAHRASRHLIYSDHDRGGDPTPLVELAQTRLAMRDVDVETMDWDAWKQQDGNWYVQLTFTAADRSRTAGWNYYRDTLTPLDDEARWLSDSGPADTGPIPHYGSGPDHRRHVEVHDAPVIPQAPIGQPDPSPVRDHQAETGRILENLRRRRRLDDDDSPRTRLRAVTEDPETHPQGAHTAPGRPEDATDDEVFAIEDPRSTEPQSHGSSSAESESDETGEPTQRIGTFDDSDQLSLLNEPGVSDHADQFTRTEHRSKRKSNRSSVPSWDEIMFGSKRD